MANPTTNYGWVMPTSASLVTNLPADFNTFGQGVDTSMQYLLGGTTGQVLSKTSATNMAFTWVTPTNQTPLTTKGDLFTFSTVDARLGVGSNGETLVADASTATGLRYQGSMAAGKNALINGGFDIWQRGTSFGSLTDGGFFADRWAVDFNGTGATRTVSRQEIAGAWATSSRYFTRYNQSVAGTSGTYNWFHTRIEGVATYAGQTVTVSFMAKADASRSVDVAISQVFGSGGSSQVNYNFGTAALTTAWQKFSFNVALTSISGKTIGTNDNLELDFKMPVNTVMTIDVGDIQLELGSVATNFTRTGGTIQGELAACQRYFFVMANGDQQSITNGFYSSTTDCRGNLRYPVQMRTTPTLATSVGTDFFAFESGSGVDGLNRLDGARITNNSLLFYNNTQASGTLGLSGELRTNSASALFTASAEL